MSSNSRVYVAAAGNKGSSSSRRASQQSGGDPSGGVSGVKGLAKQLRKQTMALEEATRKFEDALELVFSALADAGVPAERIEALKFEAGENDTAASDVLEKSQEFTRCYPYMNASGLIYLLADAWEALCEKNCAAKKLAERKFNVLMADPKADADALNAAEAAKDELVGICTQSNVRLYKIRALKALHQKNERPEEEEATGEQGEPQ